MKSIDLFRVWAIALIMGVSLTASVGCRPDFPECRKDKHCEKSEEGQKSGRLMCVNNTCQQCVEDADCGDPSLECNAGSCDEIVGYCTSVGDCGPDEKCQNNRCKPECSADADCADGEMCDGGKCVPEPECSADADCADGEECQNGSCVTVEKPLCQLETVYFTYDSSLLTGDAKSALDSNASCIQDREKPVQLGGHADERGTAEYNIALGEDRARAVFDYLKRLGVDTSRMKRISYGEERPVVSCAEDDPDSCHRQNRRVEFTFQ